MENYTKTGMVTLNIKPYLGLSNTTDRDDQYYYLTFPICR